MGQELLINELIQRKDRNPNYSLRSFARDLGISPGHVSAIINKKKPITIKQAMQIASKLNMTPSEKREFLQSLVANVVIEDGGQIEHKKLKEDEFALISEWYHLAILNLASLKNIEAKPRQISKRLNISSIQATEAIQRLERLEFITTKGGLLKRLAKPLRTSTEVPSEAIRRYHKQNLELAKEKLDSVPIHLREYSSMTMPVNVRKLALAKKMINDFKEKLSAELEVGTHDEVYTLSIQLFPLTNQEDRK